MRRYRMAFLSHLLDLMQRGPLHGEFPGFGVRAAERLYNAQKVSHGVSPIPERCQRLSVAANCPISENDSLWGKSSDQCQLMESIAASLR